MKEPDFSKIQAVFFDAGGTLFSPFPSVGEIYSEVAGRHGLAADSMDLEKRFHALWVARDGLAGLSTVGWGPGLGRGTGAAVLARGSRPRASGGGTKWSRPLTEKEERKWWRELVWEIFSEFGPLKDFEAFFEELYDRFADKEAWRLYPDVLPVLQELKRKGKVVGVVSNWDSRLFGICEGLGIKPHLDFILASAVVGAAKPHLRIFQEALDKARVKPEEAIHVGDSLEADVRGAERAGIHAIFIDRTGSRVSSGHQIPALQFLCRLFDN